MKRKYLLIIIGILITGLSFYYVVWSFSPGSFGKAESYELNVSEKALIEIINEVKSENNLNTNSFIDHQKKYWCSIYFEYTDKNEIIHAITRRKNETTTKLYFVNYKSKNDLGNWKDANEHFWWWKNSEAKNEFEKRILNKIKEKLKI